MSFDWNRYWRELDEWLDRPMGQRHEVIKQLAEEMALAIHRREIEPIGPMPEIQVASDSNSSSSTQKIGSLPGGE